MQEIQQLFSRVIKEIPVRKIKDQPVFDQMMEINFFLTREGMIYENGNLFPETFGHRNPARFGNNQIRKIIKSVHRSS
jgi:hypothetical protein